MHIIKATTKIHPHTKGETIKTPIEVPHIHTVYSSRHMYRERRGRGEGEEERERRRGRGGEGEERKRDKMM